MSNWITISTQDVYDYLAAEQVEALRSEALGEEQADPLAAVIADTACRVRGEVAAYSKNTLDADKATIPPELRGAALALIVEASQARIPSLSLSTDQIRLANAARALLKRVAAGDFAVSQGGTGGSDTDDDGTTLVVTKKIEVLGSRARPLTSARLAGL